jgi:hypothetical protein
MRLLVLGAARVKAERPKGGKGDGEWQMANGKLHGLPLEEAVEGSGEGAAGGQGRGVNLHTLCWCFWGGATPVFLSWCYRSADSAEERGVFQQGLFGLSVGWGLPRSQSRIGC